MLPMEIQRIQGKGAHVVIPRTETCSVSRNTHPVHGNTQTQRATDNTQCKETHIHTNAQAVTQEKYPDTPKTHTARDAHSDTGPCVPFIPIETPCTETHMSKK